MKTLEFIGMFTCIISGAALVIFSIKLTFRFLNLFNRIEQLEKEMDEILEEKENTKDGILANIPKPEFPKDRTN